MRTLWLSWYPHRRTTGLCAAWDVPLQIIGSKHTGLRKWLAQSAQTLRLLRRHRPEILFVQNPSLGLTVLAVLIRRLFGFYLVVDAHNEGVRPFIRSGAFVRWLTRRLLRHADATIVTNPALARDVKAAGGRPLILPDSLPTPPALAAEPSDSGEPAPQVMVISTFAPDEPIPAIMKAAASMPEVSFAVSGKAARFAGFGIELPPNVRLTGFLPDQAYWNLLASSSVICDLTLMPDCLVCGAYEGLALAKPMVLSDNPATRDLFGAAAVLSGSDADSIAEALRTALEQQASLKARALEARETFRIHWEIRAGEVLDAIQAGASRRKSGKPEKAEA